MAACLAATAPPYGQNRASITGTVRNSTGAVLPNAEVAVTDVATGVTLKTVTNAEGCAAGKTGDRMDRCDR